MLHHQFRPLGSTDDREIAAPALKALEAIYDDNTEPFDYLFAFRSRISKLVQTRLCD
jgi:hypothetical protein